ncbi:hypothetical protein [Streptosporangium longisporum]
MAIASAVCVVVLLVLAVGGSVVAVNARFRRRPIWVAYLAVSVAITAAVLAGMVAAASFDPVPAQAPAQAPVPVMEV